MGATEEFFRKRAICWSSRTLSGNEKLRNKSTDRQAGPQRDPSTAFRCTPLRMTGGAAQSDKSLAASLVRGKVYARLQPDIPA